MAAPNVSTQAIGVNSALAMVPGGFPNSVEGFLAITSGTFTLNGTTSVTVTNAAVNLTSLIMFSLNTVGGTVGAIPSVKTITAATGFTVTGTASDTSVYNFIILG